MNEGQAAVALDEFFKNRVVTFDLGAGWTFHDVDTGDSRMLNDSDLDSLLYLLDVYINGE